MTRPKAAATKAGKGEIGIQARGNTIQFNLPRHLYGGEQKRIAAGFPNTKDGWKLAEAKKKLMDIDILYERFDISLEKYGLAKAKHLKPVPTQPEAKPLDLPELWERYCEFRKKDLSHTTYENTYRKEYYNLINKRLPYKQIAEAEQIKDWMIQNTSKLYAKRLIAIFSLACEWAIRQKDIDLKENPFLGMAKDIPHEKSNKRKHDDEIDWTQENPLEDTRAFTPQERDAIIREFETNSKIKHYSAFIKFLFYSGVRLGEATALQWGDIDPDFSRIMVRRSYDYRTNTFKGTKTGEERLFPCSPTLQELLKSIKPQDASSSTLIFTSKEGNPIIRPHLQVIWKGIEKESYKGVIPRLMERGEVRQYLKLYATRHTFISIQVNNAQKNIKVVADWCGQSPEILVKHYLAKTEGEIPSDI
jgi:integrase